MEIKLKAAVCSDKGRRRQNNEDNFCLNGKYMDLKEMDGGTMYACDALPDALFAVCDGMGGEEAGEEASLLSARLCAEFLKKGGNLTDRAHVESFLRNGCSQVYKQAQQKNNRSGSTLALLLAGKAGLVAANMGDSRIYRLRGGNLSQISEDHTEMQRLLSLGEIRPEDVKRHPLRHMIRQYWGMPLEVAPFTPHISEVIPYEKGDVYLLCSDGLTDMLEDEQIAAILSRNESVEELCRLLVEAALKNGGRDNVTTLVVRVERAPEGEKTIERPRAKKRWPIIALCAATALIAICALAWFKLRQLL